MKKNFKLIVFIFMLFFTLTACQGEITELNTVTFITNSSQDDFTLECDILEEPKIELSKEGHEFGGWYFDSSCEEKVEFPYDVESNIIIYAKWTLNKYTVSFEVNEGSAIASIVVEHGKSISLPENPTREGYEFVGWYLDSSFNTPYANQAITSNTTLFAKWNKVVEAPVVEKVVVTFDVDGVKTTNEIEKNTKVSKPSNPTKEGYTFVGWLFEGSVFDFNTLIDGNITLVAAWEINAYTVTFDADGTKTTVNTDYNTKVSKSENPYKEGHTFKCWLLNGVEYDFDTPVKSNITLVASFEVNTYTVTFNVEGSETTINVKYNELATKPTDPEKEGYTFTGWILNEEVFDFNTPIKNDVVLLASFEINKYTVTFDIDGATTTQEVEHNQKATKPANPEKEGFNFVYWSVDGEEYDFDTLVTSDLTLVALFSYKPYVVTFDVNGNISTYEVEQGNALPKPADPELYGHTFICWTLDGEEYDFSQVLTSDITLVAKFEQIMCTVTFDVDGVISTVEVKYGSYVAEPTETPVKEGHTFSNWLLNNDVYYFNEIVIEDITLVAGFNINTYTVTFIVESGTTKEVNVTYNETVEEYIPTSMEDGYQFDGWFLKGEKFDFTTPIKSNISLYGSWSKITYIITFELSGGIGTENTVVEYGQAITLPANPTRENFTFEGWYLDSSYVEAYSDQLIYNNTILYAKWETDLETFTVTFVDEQNVILSVDVIENEKVSIPTLVPEKYGYTFKCWTLDGEEYDFDTLVTSDITLSVSWEIIVCVVTFDVDGVKTTQNINYGEVLTKPTDPTKEGHIFEYWICDSEEYYFNEAVEGDITLSAKFMPINYAITFDCDNTQYIYTSADYGTKLTMPEEPTREGYTFVCWTLDGEEYDFDTLVTGEMTLVAKWEANTYIVTFDVDGTLTEVEVNYGECVSQPESPTKEGHNFNYWVLGDEAYNFNSLITESITLTASWTKLSYSVILYNNGNEYVNETMYYGDEFTLPEEPTPSTGYYFAGWVKNDGSDEYLEDSFIVKDNVSAYARYIAIEYTLTFVLNGGEYPEVHYPTFTIETPTYYIYPVVKEGYTFLGWTSNTVTTPVEIYTIENGTTGDLVLTANFEINVYTVTFESNGGTAVEAINVEYNNTFDLPANPTLDGYTFAGWYTDESLTQAYTTGSLVTESFTLYAKWTEMVANEAYTYMWHFDGTTVTYSNEASFTGSIQGKTDTFKGLTIDATVTSGKVAYNTAGYTQINGGTTIKFTVSSAAKVTVVAFSGQYNYTINGTAATANTSTFDVAAGEVVFEAAATISESTTAYIYSISYILNETTGDSGNEEETLPINSNYTYMWHFDGTEVTYSNEASYKEYYEKTTATFEGLSIDASSGKLAYNTAGHTQFNVNTTITFTVSSAAKVTVVSFPGQYNYTINETTATANETTVEVGAGNVVITATNTAYIYSISYILNETTGDSGNEEETPDDDLDVASLELGFNAVIQSSSGTTAGNGVYFNNTVQQVYNTNSTLDLSYLTVTAISSTKEETVLTESDYTVSNFDSTTAGEKTITITYGGASASFKVWVVDTAISMVDGVAKVMVDAEYTGTIGAVANGHNMFTKIQQALDFIELSEVKSTVSKELYICSGEYNEKLEITIPKLTIIGENVDDTIIEWDSLYGIKDESGFVHTTDSTQTVAIREQASNCIIKNLTISNFYNSLEAFDSVFGEGYSEHRALAMLVQADKLIIDNCKLLGYQDTLELMTGRQYFTNTYICGTTDFIFGTNNTSYFYKCQIHSINAEGNRGSKTNGGFVTAFKGMNKGDSDAIVYGAIFDACDFTADEDLLTDGNTAIARPWGEYSAVMVMNSTLDSHISTTENTSGTASINVRYAIMNVKDLLTAEHLQYFEYNNTGAGAITESQVGVTVLTDSSVADKYSDLDTIFGKTNGNLLYSDAWNPTKLVLSESYNITFGSAGNYTEFMDVDWIDLSGVTITDNSNSNNNSQIKNGEIKITLSKGAVVTINSYSGYTSYTLSDGTTTTDTITGTTYSYTAEADVTLTITPQSGNNFFYSIYIDNSNVTSTEDVELQAITASNYETEYLVGDTLDLSNIVVKAVYTDGSSLLLSSVDYEINLANVNMNEAGTYEIDIIYNDLYYTFNITVSNVTINVTEVAGYNEGAYIEFDSSDYDESAYTVTYSLANSSTTTEVDSELLRKSNDTIRCDILGLAQGSYNITITNNETEATITKEVSVTAHDRSGYAHFNTTSGVGAYNNDGTLKSNALVIYVNDSNKNTVTATINGTTYTGLANILKKQANSSNPLVIRIIGRIGAATWNTITYEGSSLSAASITGADGTALEKATMSESEIIEAGYNTLNTESATVLNNLTNKVVYSMNEKTGIDEFDSYFNMLDISGASNVTVEGVGTDAEIFQWGFTWSKCSSIEVRNLTFTDYPEDACSFQGSNNDNVNTYGNYWVHNNTFNRGKNYWDVTYEQDKPAGDGATDFKFCNSITSSYNKFNNCKKTGLVGGSNSHLTKSVTFHHNFYNEVGSRLPLGRQANMHIYNNYYYNCGTAQDIRANAFVLSEANYFEGCTNPQKVTADDDYLYPVIKSFGDYLTGCGESQATVVTSRTATLTGLCLPDGSTDYTNFDINSELFYYDSENQKSNVTLLTDAATAKTDCMNLAGVLKN